MYYLGKGVCNVKFYGQAHYGAVWKTSNDVMFAICKWATTFKNTD